jgi:hypothetical protein
MNELIERLKKITAKKAKSETEDFNVNDWSGGNVDDAFQIGYDDGQIHLAESVLETLEKL